MIAPGGESVFTPFGETCWADAVTANDEDGKETRYFIAPAGGGLPLAKGKVQVVTPKSPLGRALLGKHEGDECEVQVGAKARTLEIESVE